MAERELFDAAGVGDIERVRFLIDEAGVDPTCQDSYGWTTLHMACRWGHFHIVRYLVEDAKVPHYLAQIRDNAGWTPLHMACRCEHFHVARYLIENAAEINAQIKDKAGWTALHHTCYTRVGLPEVRYLVETAGLSVHTTTGDKRRTPLHYVCINRHATSKSTEIVRYLVEQQKADVSVEDKFGDTPLHLVLQTERIDLVRYLLTRVQSVDGKTLRLGLNGFWDHNMPWDVKELVLEKYALGQGQAAQFSKLPIHTLLNFPIPSRKSLKECVEHYPKSALLLLDKEGRFPVHLALTSKNRLIGCASVVAFLAWRSPKSMRSRDPTTGLTPFESAALKLVSSGNHAWRNDDWLNVVYKLLREHPERVAVGQNNFRLPHRRFS